MIRLNEKKASTEKRFSLPRINLRTQKIIEPASMREREIDFGALGASICLIAPWRGGGRALRFSKL
jgi:hypothetical protein